MRMVLDLLYELTNTRISACFTTACGNPDTLKSMSTSLNVVDEPIGCPITTGLPVLSRSASTFLSVFSSSSKRSQQIGILAVKRENVY